MTPAGSIGNPVGDVVTEVQDVFPFDADARRVRRLEHLLLGQPAQRGPKLWRDMEPLEAVHFAPEWKPVKFAPPTAVYEGEYLRVEWQTMDFRQPFYHRNADVDELSFQIAGERTLMTEIGTVELRQGDFSRIPRGVAHDNYGRQQSHMLFYIPAPVAELRDPAGTSEMKLPPFEGWVAAPNNELISECLGGPEHDVAVHPIDESMLLNEATSTTERLNVLRPEPGHEGTNWLYRGLDVMIGKTVVRPSSSEPRVYTRHLDVCEIQFQTLGRRTLLSQRGFLELEAGDLVCIPVGVAFTSIVDGPAEHVTVVSRKPVPRIAQVAKTARPATDYRKTGAHA